MFKWATSTWVADWMGAWLITTATRPRTKLVINSLQLNFNAALTQLVPPLWLVHFLIMAPSARFICASPLRLSYSFADAEIRSRTSRGKCWALVRWVDFWLRLQVSVCHFCKFNSCSLSALPYAHLSVETNPFLVLFGLLSIAACSDFSVLPTMLVFAR